MRIFVGLHQHRQELQTLICFRMGWRICVEELLNLNHRNGIFGLVAQDMGFRKVEKLGYGVLTSFCISVFGHSLQTDILYPEVVFLMGEQMANVDAA